MAEIIDNIAFDETNPDVVNIAQKEWLTYKWDYPTGKPDPKNGWYKTWVKIPDPHFTELDMKGSPLSQYRGEYKGMPIKQYLLISIQEDLDMIILEKNVFMKLFSEKYNELMNEVRYIKKIW